MNDSSSDPPIPVSPWLTYADAAARFGISPEAIRQLAMRYRWPRRKRNDDPAGRVQVLIPDDFQWRPRTAVQRQFNGRAPEEGSVLLEAWRLERERADRAEKQRDAAISRAEAADFDRRATDARADRAEQALAAERDRTSVLQGRVEGLHELWKASEAGWAGARRQAFEAAQTADAVLQADEERRRQGLPTRLWAAWRGE